MPNSNTIDWFEIVKFVVEIILTVAAVGISVVALIQTKKQIKLSNKHQLFDRRMEKYNIVEELISCFYKAVLVCDDGLGIEDCSTSILLLLLDNSYLEDAKWAINHPLAGKAGETLQRKGNWLYMISKEIPIIFENNEAELVSDFVHLYSVLIYKLNDYNYWKCCPGEVKKQEEVSKSITSLYQRTIKTINQIEETNSEGLLLEQIKLT